jgi:aspartyl-tRNA(Asn)/glutamyl-tRNA(Gln) amidotransferase subunit A
MTAEELAIESIVVEGGVSGLYEAYAEGVVTPSDALRACYKRVRRFNRDLNAVRLPDERMIEDAVASTRRWEAGLQRGPLDGAPVMVKSNIAVKGLPWDAGIGARRDLIAEEDAEVVRRLRGAGALVLGTLNMEEGAFGAKTDNPWFGPTMNPWKKGYTPGGSSGGSGAAVAAGLCAAALGTDTMGSVRIPAAYCGVVGFKPPNGAVPEEGVLPLSPTLDTTGLLARSVLDAQRVYEALTGVTIERREPQRITALAFEGEVQAWQDLRRLFAQSLVNLAGYGFETDRAALPEGSFGALRRAGLLLAEAEGMEVHREGITASPEGYSEGFKSMLAYAEKAGQAKVREARERIEAFRALPVWDGHEVFALPTTPTPAFPMKDDQPGQADLTALANASGLAAISVPMGFVKRLPVGIQFLSRDVGKLFEVAGVFVGAGQVPMPRAYEPPLL